MPPRALTDLLDETIRHQPPQSFCQQLQRQLSRDDGALVGVIVSSVL